MAGNTPTLTNENFHMFEPSPIETSLVNALSNKEVSPNIFPLLAQYQAKNQANGQQYQDQISKMHDAQMYQFDANLANTRRGQWLSTLKDAGGAPPGMLRAATSAGLLPAGMDLSDFDSGIAAASSAKNMGEGLRGLGAAAMGGFTGLAPAAQTLAGPGVGQGPAAIVQAAQVKEAGANARHSTGDGAVSYSAPVGEIGPNQPTAHWKQRGGGPPHLPGVGPQSSITPQQLQQSVMAALPSIAANSPEVHADIVAGALNGMPNIIPNPHGPGMIIQGKTGQYNASGFA